MRDFSIRGVLGLNTGDFRRGVQESLGDMRRLRGGMTETAATARLLTFEERRLNEALRDQRRELGALSLQFAATRNAMRTLALRAAIAGFASLTSMILALGNALSNVVEQAGLAATALGVTGVSAIGALIQTAGVAQLALNGIGKALNTTGVAHEKAMAKLTKPAQEFVRELSGVRKGILELRLLAQQGMFPGVAKGLQDMKVLAGPIKQTVFDTAQVLGYLAQKAGELAKSKGFAQDIGKIGQRNALTLEKMGLGALGALDGVRQLLVVGDPLIAHITTGWEKLGTGFDDMMKKARKNGSLKSFLDESRDAYDRFTSTIGSGGKVVLNVLKASNPVAIRQADAFKDMAKHAAEWTGTADGQKKILQYFERLEPVTREWGRSLGATIKALGTLGVDGAANAERAMRGYRTQLLPLLESMSASLNAHLLPALMDVSGQLLTLLKNARPALEIVGKVAAFVAEKVADVLRIINSISDNIGGVGGAVAALTLGGGVLLGWLKLRASIAATVLSMRQLVGLAPKVLAPGMIGTASGQGGVVAAVGGFGGGGGRGGVNRGGVQRTYVDPRLGLRNGVPAGFAPVYAGTMGARGMPPAFIPRTPLRSTTTGRFVPRTNAYARYQAQLAGAVQSPIQPLTRAERAGANLNGLARSTASGMAAGAKAAMPAITGLLKTSFSIAAISGVITAASSKSSKDGFSQALQNAISGATFGALDSVDTSRSKTVQGLVGALRTNRIPTSIQEDAGKRSRPNGFGKFLGDVDPTGLYALANSAFGNDKKKQSAIPDLRKSSGVQEFRTVWLKALLDGKKITDDQFKAVNKAATELQTQLKGKESSKSTLGLDLNSKDFTRAADEMVLAMQNLKDRVPGDLRDARNQLKNTMASISRTLVDGSTSSTTAMSAAFNTSAANIKKAMKQGLINVKSGTDEINKLMIEKLKLFGFSTKEAANIQRGQRPDGGPSNNARGGAVARITRNGLTTIGRRGAAGRDNIPISAIVGAGEDVAVINRHQRKYIDSRLADVGGLDGVFSGIRTEHSKPRAGRFAEGGFIGKSTLVTGDTDYGAQMAQALNALATFTHHPIFVQSGGRTLAEQAALVKQKGLFGPGNPTGAAAPSSSAPHVRGIAADITPGRDVFASAAGKFGLGFPIPKEPWHIQLMGAIAEGVKGGGGSVAGAVKSAVSKIAAVKLGGVSGLFGGMQQGAVDEVRDAANAYMVKAAADAGASGGVSGGGGGSGSAAAPDQVKAWLTQALNITGHYSPGNLAALIGRTMQESGGNPRAINNWDSNAAAGHPSKGLLQTIDSTFASYRLPGHDDIYNPVDNAIAAIRYMFGRYGHIVGPGGGGYALGGFVAAPTLGGPLPSVDTNDAVLHKAPSHAKTKKKAKKNVVVPAPHAPPNLTPVTVGKSKAKLGKIKQPKISAKVRALIAAMKTGKLEEVQELAAALAREQNIDTQENLYTAMEGQFGLTDEFPTVVMEDTEDYKDFTNYLTAHPEALRGAASIADFQEKYGTSLEVVNWDGMNVQGRYMRGINQRVGGEIDPLLGVRQAILGLATGPGGVQELRGTAATKLAAGVKERADRIAAINSYLVGPVKKKKRTGSIALLDSIQHSINAESKKSMTWQQAVAENERRIELIKDNNADLSNAPDGVTYGDLGGKDGVRRRNQKMIDDLRTEIAELKKKKPKGGSPKRQRQLYDQLRAVRHEHQTLTGDDSGKGDAGFRGVIRQELDDWTSTSTNNADSLRQLNEVLVPQFNLSIDTLNKEKGELLGTRVASPTASTSAAADNKAEINALLQQENDDLRKANALANLQFGVFSGAQGMVRGRMMGAFAHGGIVDGVTQGPGLAIVHNNERLRVDADPEGPFGNRASVQGAGGPIPVELTVRLDDAGLLRIVDARVQGQAAKVTSRNLGREARVIAAAPGGRGR